MLKLNKINVYYRSSRALGDVTLEVNKGEVVALLGANGAGKSTTLRTISGFLTPTSGEITFFDTKINGLSPPTIVKMGISHCPEGRRVFPEMNVYDNLVMMYERVERRWKEEQMKTRKMKIDPRVEASTLAAPAAPQREFEQLVLF